MIVTDEQSLFAEDTCIHCYGVYVTLTRRNLPHSLLFLYESHLSIK